MCVKGRKYATKPEKDLLLIQRCIRRFQSTSGAILVDTIEDIAMDCYIKLWEMDMPVHDKEGKKVVDRSATDLAGKVCYVRSGKNFFDSFDETRGVSYVNYVFVPVMQLVMKYCNSRAHKDLLNAGTSLEYLDELSESHDYDRAMWASSMLRHIAASAHPGHYCPTPETIIGLREPEHTVKKVGNFIRELRSDNGPTYQELFSCLIHGYSFVKSGKANKKSLTTVLKRRDRLLDYIRMRFFTTPSQYGYIGA